MAKKDTAYTTLSSSQIRDLVQNDLSFVPGIDKLDFGKYGRIAYWGVEAETSSVHNSVDSALGNLIFTHRGRYHD